MAITNLFCDNLIVAKINRRNVKSAMINFPARS